MKLLCKYDFFDLNTKTIAGGEEPKDAFVVINSGDTIPSGYTNISSVQNWKDYGESLCADYLQYRERVKGELDVVSWSGLTNSEKDIVIDFYLKETNKSDEASNGEKVAYLMGVHGLDLIQSKGKLISVYGPHHIKEIDSCKNRANSELLYQIIAKYLTLTDAGDLIKITHKLFDLYKSQAIRGTLDGNAGEGLFNFLESTVSTSYETTGLEQQGYVLNTGTYSEFITELMDVLRNGNY
jgi:hypothetical protein